MIIISLTGLRNIHIYNPNFHTESIFLLCKSFVSRSICQKIIPLIIQSLEFLTRDWITTGSGVECLAGTGSPVQARRHAIQQSKLLYDKDASDSIRSVIDFCTNHPLLSQEAIFTFWKEIDKILIILCIILHTSYDKILTCITNLYGFFFYYLCQVIIRASLAVSEIELSWSGTISPS